MTDPARSETKKESQRTSGASSERYVLLIVGWIVAIVLLPLHALLIFNLFFIDRVFAGILWILIFGIPLALVDTWLIRWFVDNFRVFRWINRDAVKPNRDSQI